MTRPEPCSEVLRRDSHIAAVALCADHAVNGAGSAERSLRLELIIVALILVEIAIAAYQIFSKQIGH